MALSVKVGTYTGDGGTTKAITGVGFQPKVVIVLATTGTGDASGGQMKTNGMTTGATGATITLGENHYLTTGQIDSLDADGFTVRDQKNLNTTVYYYIAFAGTSCVTGSYAGNSTDNRGITGVGFRPKWVVIGGDTNVHMRHKSTATGDAVDSSQFFTVLADSANAIQSLDADGFTVGTDAQVNATGTNYYYFCVTGTNVTSGTYTGNGSDNRAITGVGFTPTSVMVKGTSSTNQAGWRTGEAGDLTSKVRANTAPAANLIQSLDSDGFTIGTDGIVNTNTSTYYWVAFGAAASGPASVKTVNGLATASVKTKNDLAIASVKTINGLA